MHRGAVSTQGLFPLVFAVSAPFVLSPLLNESAPFRLVYALCCSALLYTSRAVPVQTVALPSLALLPPLASPEASRDAWLSAMRLVAAALLCGSVTESSSLVARVALRLLSLAGVRVCKMALALAVAAGLLAVLLSAASTALGTFFLAAVCSQLTRLLRSGPLEEIQRRCLLRKVTRELAPTERRVLARLICREQCPLPARRHRTRSPDTEQQETEESSGLLRGFDLKPDVKQPAAHAKSDSRTKWAPPNLTPPIPGPRRTSRIKLLLPPEKPTDDVASQRIVAPGESSPDWIKRTLRDEHAEFLEPIVLGNPQLMEIYLWHSSRYTKLEGYLLYSTLLVHSLVSMTSFTGSPEYRLMIDYDRRDAEEDFQSARIFCAAVAEAGRSVAAESSSLRYTTDAKQTSLQRYYELFPLLCLALWVMFNIYLRTSEEKLVTDYGVLVPLLGWMSVFTQPRALGRRVAEPVERVVRTLPWGALLLVGCQLAAHAAWPSFAPAAGTASVRLAHSLGGQRPVVIQLALTSVSCLLTEFLGAHQTVALLLPAAAILAQQRKCPWPYLAVPLTAASSIGVILPTASVTMAIVHDLANLKPDVTVLPGILTKVSAMLALVLGANTLGSLLLGWTIPVEVADYGLNASDLVAGADGEHGV
ncbi:Na(+)/citrate cotransporter-like isoform X2 [Dermacentor albipictus]|uniref:Na(+)/citrate cotransporter-like isoform X2 n=1 Tax=Dermacentor albipictus TaxID=60249 RepID=UPI0031FD4A34